jgi:hypothetical protein
LLRSNLELNGVLARTIAALHLGLAEMSRHFFQMVPSLVWYKLIDPPAKPLIWGFGWPHPPEVLVMRETALWLLTSSTAICSFTAAAFGAVGLAARYAPNQTMVRSSRPGIFDSAKPRLK